MCIRDRASSIALYRGYKGWAEEYGENPVSHKAFAALMNERGFHKNRVTAGTMYSGIGLRAEEHHDNRPGTHTVQPPQPHLAKDSDGEEV